MRPLHRADRPRPRPPRRPRRVRSRRGVVATLPALAAALLLAGCQGAADLEPAPPADQVATTRDAARAVVQDVEVTAQAVDWPGPRDIGSEVTPLRLVLTNHSERPLRVRYQEFALIDGQGRRHAALPPWRMQGAVAEEVTARLSGPITDPLVVHSGFLVAPAYRTIYPTWDRWTGTFAHDPWWYDTYATYWREIPLPTPSMRAHGLPEGVLQPDGHLEGWLFFEHVDPDRERVVLRVDLVEADRGREVGEVRIPFRVR